MNKKAYCAVLAVILCLLPEISRARYLNTANGRFQTMDTFAGDQEDPQTLHKYGYAGNDPINKIDPSGHEIEEIVEVETVETGWQATRAVAVAEGKRLALSKIEKIGMSIAASLLLAQELGYGPGDIINTIQTQTARHANPTKSPNAYVKYQCEAFALDAKTYFARQGDQPQIITYNSYPGKTVGDNITAVEGFGLFGGENISLNGHHEGVLVDGEVFDNNVPFGVPRDLWENGYEVAPIDRPWNYFTLRQANDLGYGVINPN